MVKDSDGNSVSGSITYDAATKVATFKPDTNLAYLTTYIATATNAIRDMAGNGMAASKSWSFTTSASLDTNPPVTSLTTSPTSPDGANGWFKTLPNITFTRDETGTTYYQWDSTSTAGWVTYSTSINALEGVHTIYFYSVDTAGNNEDVKSKSIKADTVAPATFDLIAPVDNYETDNPQPVFSWSASSDSGSSLACYQLYIDDTVTADNISLDQTSFQLPYNLTPGSHSWYVQAVDVAGNVTLSTSTHTVTAVDTIFPVASELTPTGIVYSYLPTISANLSDVWSGIDPNSVIMKLDGAPTFAYYNATFGTVSYTPSVILGRGKHHVELSFRDIAGNQSTATWDFIVYGTPVSGIISQDTTWTVGNSPYIIEADVTVDTTATLEVEPGVIIKLWKSTLFVNGNLLANGTEQNPIHVTSLRDDSIGGDTNGDGTTTSPAPADWGSIYLRSSTSTAKSTRIKYANVGISIESANSVVDTSTLSYCYKAGILVSGAAQPKITNNTITYNAGSVSQTGLAIQMDINASPTMNGNTVSNNNYNGIQIKGKLVADKALQNLDGLPFIITGVNVKVDSGKTLTVKPGTIIKFEGYVQDDPEIHYYLHGYGLVIFGALNTESSSEKVYFTSIRDDSVGGDTNGDGASSPAPRDWLGIAFAPGSAGSLDNLSFKYSDWGIYVWDSSVNITNSTISYNDAYGIWVDGHYPSFKVTHSTFEGNYHAIFDLSYTSSQILSNYFKNNWMTIWVDPETPAVITGNDFVGSLRFDIYGGGRFGHWNEVPLNGKNNNWSLRAVHTGDVLSPVDWSALNNHAAYAFVTEDIGDGYKRVIFTDLDPTPVAIFPFRAGYGGRNAEYKYGLRTYSGYFGEPVNSSTGNFTATYEDISLRGKGISINFSRSYNSQDAIRKGPLGFGWTHPYEQGLRFSIEETATTDSTITAFLDEGRRQEYTKSILSGTYESQPGVLDKLIKNDDGTYSIINPDQSRLNFDANGILTSLVDSYENTTTLTYTNHLLTSVIAPGGRSITLTYSNDKIIKVEDNAGRFIEYGYDANGDLVTFKDLNGKTTTYTYDSEHQLLAEKLPKPSTHPFLTNHYANGKVDYQLDAFLSKMTFSYDTANKKTDLTDNKGTALTHFHDGFYRQTQEINEAGGIKSYEYNDLGLVAAVTDENTHTTRFFYDANGNTTEIIDAASHSTKAAYDLSNNNILWKEDASGVRTNYSYDETGKFLTSIINPVTTTYFEYYDDGLLRYLISADATTTCEYNVAGDLTKVIDPLGKATSYEYDESGRKTASIDANNHKTNIAYDGRGNVISIKDPLSFVFPSERHQVDFGYDDNGNKETFTDANNNTTRYIYDDMNLLTGVIDALENTTTYTYDANYNLKTVSDARGNTTTYDYWANNLLKSVKDALQNTRQFFYDGAGNLTKVIYPNSNEKYSEYTDDNLLKRVTYKNELTS